MNKDTKIILISGAVLILFTYILLYTPLFNFGTIKSIGTHAQNLALKPAVNAKKIIKQKAEKQKAKKQKLYLRDPFAVGFAYEKSTTVEGGGEKPKQTYFAIQGIFFPPENKPYALIDDRMVYQGQKIYNWEVKKILSDRVLLSKGGYNKVLRLKLGVE